MYDSVFNLDIELDDQFDDIRSSKGGVWDGISTLFRPTYKSGTEFTFSAVYVPRPLSRARGSLDLQKFDEFLGWEVGGGVGLADYATNLFYKF